MKQVLLQVREDAMARTASAGLPRTTVDEADELDRPEALRNAEGAEYVLGGRNGDAARLILEIDRED